MAAFISDIAHGLVGIFFQIMFVLVLLRLISPANNADPNLLYEADYAIGLTIVAMPLLNKHSELDEILRKVVLFLERWPTN